MFKTLKNAWKIPELKKKLLFTLLIIFLYRLGANIPVPYVGANVQAALHAQFSGSILEFLNVLSGEAMSRATLLALGVSPYITASIVMQLLTIAIPALERLSKQGDEGKKKITAITRMVTVALALITSIGYVGFLESSPKLVGMQMLAVAELSFFQKLVMVACYCAGAALVMWMAEKINDYGIGNGISIILFANIIAGGFSLFRMLWVQVFTVGMFGGFRWQGLIISVVEIICIIGMIMLIVGMSDAERRIPIQYAKRVVGRKMYGGQSTNLPLKVNMSGVMPIIFANSIVSIPSIIATLFFANSTTKFGTWVNNFISNWFNYNTWPYLIVFFVLLMLFAFFYIAISFNPVEVANNIQSNGGSIRGIRSGKPTADFIKKVLNRVTLLGALLVAFIACVPMLANIIVVRIPALLPYLADGGVSGLGMLAFGGSSIMIVVGVALETVRELEAQLSLRNYKGFLD